MMIMRDIEYVMSYRKQQAAEHPDDQRHQDTVDALRSVQLELQKGGGDDHPSLSELKKSYEKLEEQAGGPDPEFIQEWDKFIREFGGFYGGRGLGNFIHGLTKVVQRWLPQEHRPSTN